ncbi:MAG: response regulator [Chloroflexi bacterium]|nr:response regulator [Chloroflexota bacterium]
MEEVAGRVLVVDDNRTNRLMLSANLSKQGHDVATAEDGRVALEMLSTGEFDLVLLDIMMPGMNGYQVLESMKADADLRNIPVIVISALDELDAAVRCIEMGAEDFLTKPFNAVFLKARLESCVRRKRLRDLEQAYLHQEMMLRQSEKLATLGRLSAGMAHELNNPAAAVQSGSKQIRQQFEKNLRLGQRLRLDAGTLGGLVNAVMTAVATPQVLDSLTRSDYEQELADWLEGNGIENAWELAPDVTAMGLRVADGQRILEQVGPDALADTLAWMAGSYAILSVSKEVQEAAQRMSELVKALKTYTYMDRAPVQNVNIHEGLENTLVMMRSRLGHGIQINRDYDESIPVVEAFSSELNQVWTNLVDNAAAAMNGHGQLSIRTRLAHDRVVVEICDTGPGIPPDIQPKIFDPFFTTKPIGEGTGLGLNISYNIIVQKHKGEITVDSEPGRTCFTVSIPLRLSQS